MGGKIWQTLTLIALMTLETSCGREDQPKGDPATQDRGPVAQEKGMAVMEMKGWPGLATGGGWNDERKLKQISAKTEGWIERLYVDFTGQLVRRGDPLFSVYSPELVSAQGEYPLALHA